MSEEIKPATCEDANDRGASLLDCLHAEMYELLISKVLMEVPFCHAIYIFGSWGTIFQRNDSDIDIAILPLQPLKPIQRWNLAQLLASIARRDVDLVDLLKASTVLRMQVVAHGKLLYSSGSIEVDQFEDTVFSSYARLNEERHEILADIMQRRNIYGK